MLSNTKLALVGTVAIFAHAAFAAGVGATRSLQTAELATSVPKADIESACRDAQAAALPESITSAYASCVRDERTAYEQLRQRWANYSAAARETCVEPGDGVPFSYVELLTCLEMQPGGSLTVQGPGPDGIGSFEITAPQSPQPMASPSSEAGRSLGPEGLHSLDSTSPLPAP